MDTNDILAVLQSSQNDKNEVRIYIAGHLIQGQVVHVNETCVELRHGTNRAVVRLERIDAVGWE